MDGTQLFLFLTMTLASCAFGPKPCSDSGDISWPVKFEGDKKCFQKKDADGKYVNEGEFKQLDRNGRVVLIGFLKDGKKNGMWVQYNEKGEKVVEKYFENGIEKSLPPLPSGSGDTNQNKK